MRKLLIFFFTIPIAAWCNPGGLSEKIDVSHYVFSITLNDSTDLIDASAVIHAQCKKESSTIELDLMSLHPDGKGMRVSQVTSNGSQLKFNHQNNVLSIILLRAVKANEDISFEVFYSGIPKDGLIISKNKFGDRTFFADNWPNRGRHWPPIIDHPADKSTVEFIITAPIHYDVIANGRRIEESFINQKQKLTHYKEEIPISTKVMVIGVARFAVQQAGMINNTIPIETWVYPQNRKEGFFDYAAAVKIMNYFIRMIGPYSYEKLANVQSKTIFGGLENASAIFYSENSVTGKAAHEMLIAHEVAHQWFGDSATESDWHHIWLSEGFATYFALLFTEFAHGDEKRQAEMKTDRDQVIAFHRKQSLPVIFEKVDDPLQILNTNSYQKGSWVLHMLRREVGDSAFWKGIRAYYKEFQNKTASSNDFERVMMDVSNQDLKPFFSQWLRTPGHPVVTVSHSYNPSNRKLSLEVVQETKNPLFTFPLEVGIRFKDSPDLRIEKLVINGQKATFSFDLTSKPTEIILDPLVNLLFEGILKN